MLIHLTSSTVMYIIVDVAEWWDVSISILPRRWFVKSRKRINASERIYVQLTQARCVGAMNPGRRVKKSRCGSHISSA